MHAKRLCSFTSQLVSLCQAIEDPSTKQHTPFCNCTDHSKNTQLSSPPGPSPGATHAHPPAAACCPAMHKATKKDKHASGRDRETKKLEGQWVGSHYSSSSSTRHPRRIHWVRVSVDHKTFAITHYSSTRHPGRTHRVWVCVEHAVHQHHLAVRLQHWQQAARARGARSLVTRSGACEEGGQGTP